MARLDDLPSTRTRKGRRFSSSGAQHTPSTTSFFYAYTQHACFRPISLEQSLVSQRSAKAGVRHTQPQEAGSWQGRAPVERYAIKNQSRLRRDGEIALSVSPDAPSEPNQQSRNQPRLCNSRPLSGKSKDKHMAVNTVAEPSSEPLAKTTRLLIRFIEGNLQASAHQI